MGGILKRQILLWAKGNCGELSSPVPWKRIEKKNRIYVSIFLLSKSFYGFWILLCLFCFLFFFSNSGILFVFQIVSATQRYICTKNIFSLKREKMPRKESGELTSNACMCMRRSERVSLRFWQGEREERRINITNTCKVELSRLSLQWRGNKSRASENWVSLW